MKQGFRQSMAWLHSWSGLLLGWLLFAIAATGTASVFRPEISAWMRPEAQPSTNQVQAVGAAVDYLRIAAPNPAGWYLQAPDARSRTTTVSYDDATADDGYRLVALDAVTGRPDGMRDTLGGEFFYRFHFELQLPYPWGRLLASAAAMMMLVALISGIITHRRIFADFFTLRLGKGKRSWLDVHNVLGVFALPFHLMITFTGLLTLVTLTLPWAVSANYGSDIARAFSEADPGHYSRPRAERPAPLGDTRAMLADAQQRFEGGRFGYVTIENPGDAAAVLNVTRNDDEQIAAGATKLAYDAVTGRLLSAHSEARPAKKLYDVLYGLHMGRFAPGLTRWLYFLCGLSLCAAIATGLVLWTQSRLQWRGFGHVLVARLTVGASGGLPAAMAAFFIANRLIPAAQTNRADGEVSCFFLVWGAMILLGLASSPRRGWAQVMALSASAWLVLPFVSAATVGWPKDGLNLTVDLVALAFGATAACIAAKLARFPQAQPADEAAAAC